MQNNEQSQNKRQIQIKLSDDILRGAYANATQLMHTKEEFVIDFLNLSPHQGVGIVNSRVIMSPGHLKRVILAMQDNLKKYENQFGKIKEADSPDGQIGFSAN